MSMAMQAIGDVASTYVTVSGLDKQHDSTKRTCPKYSLPKASQDGRTKVFLSKKQPQDLVGKDSPGFQYSPNRMKELPHYSFGTAPARPPLTKPRYPETTNDLLHSSPDGNNGKVKFFGAPSLAQYKSCSAPDAKKVLIGNSSRHDKISAPDLCQFPMGGASPGPARYRPDRSPPIRMAHAPNVDTVPPKYSMGLKTKPLGSEWQTPPKVGPGVYPVQEACGEQPKSTNPTMPKWGLYHTDRYPIDKYERDRHRLWDGEGKRKAQFSRVFSSPPSYSFGTSTRPGAQRVAIPMTSKDGGPARTMGVPRQVHPPLPPKHIGATIDVL
jgi:hypothetical protein